MALVPIVSQSWDTTSVFNPTRMNNIENNIAIAATAEGTKYSNGVSVKDKIDGLIQSVNISGTTNQYGNIELSTISANYILPSSLDTDTNYPFSIFKATGTSRWNAHFFDWDGSAKSSLSVSGKFYYYTK